MQSRTNPAARAVLYAKILFSVLLLAALAGCQTTNTLPQDYQGPTATIKDSAVADTEKHGALLSSTHVTRADFFVVTHVDGKRIINSRGHTASVYSGLGGTFKPVLLDRKIVAGQKVTVTIEGRTHFGAPIHELVAEKTYPVSGDVSFLAAPNRAYVVKGRLGEGRSTVWVEDAATGRAVSKRITL